MKEEELKSWLSLLKSLEFFTDFEDDELAEILKRCEMKKFPTQSYLVREGGRDPSLFVILKGKVNVIKNVSRGEKKKLTDISQGASFGEMSIILNEPRSSSVMAVGEVYVLVIKKEDLGGLSETNQRKLYQLFAVSLANMVKRKDQEI